MLNRRTFAKHTLAAGASLLAAPGLVRAATGPEYLAIYNGNDIAPGQSGGDLGVATGSDPWYLGRRGRVAPRSEQATTWGNEQGKRLACPVRVGDEIYLWYEGYDGTRWQIFFEVYSLTMRLRYAHNVPVLKHTDVSGASSVERPSVLYEPADTAAPFKMVFARATSGINGTSLWGATSLDGINWTVLGQFLGLGASGFDTQLITSSGRLLNVGGTYYLFYSGYNGTRWQSGYATSTAFQTSGWTKSANNPILTPRGQTPQVIAADTDPGTREIYVPSTAGYDVGAPIVIYATWTPNGAVWEFNVVDEIPDGTTLRCRYPFQGGYLVSVGHKVTQIHSGSVDITEVWYEDGKWKCLFTAFQFVPDYGLETSGYAETDDLAAGFTIDPTVWPLPMLDKRATWDRTSAENLKFIRLD